ncbi:hypothetical protein [Nocardioides sp. TF02-7]|uniref:hypothetical protein n=1 Tax=Nocardioides sp. TF02-7 TaxID=2917724 RepID=UPI001F05D262|nr:hypothetical protein [Nocardioides sp. TF02-7]UMG94042.1 hypothetical protein MF408_08275 [Nocardioides sp. TF02-7]
MDSRVDHRLLEHLRHVQSGVLARWRLKDAGLNDNDIERMIRRRDLTPAHPGVYVDHTGPLTPRQREWVAVLAYWPAALCHESAVPRLRPLTIHVGVDLHRTLQPIAGTELHRIAHLQERTDWRAAPPRTKVDHATIDVMVKRITGDDVAGAYAALAEACFSATRPDRVERALARRARVPHRGLVAGMLSDLRTGACSVLERGSRQPGVVGRRCQARPRGARGQRHRHGSAHLRARVR